MTMTEDEKKYFEYVTKYLEYEAKSSFENSIEEADKTFLYHYSSSIMDEICVRVEGINKNEDLKNYLFNEILVASEVGFLLNSANKRYSLESLENCEFIQNRHVKKEQVIEKETLKEKIVKFLINILDKKGMGK